MTYLITLIENWFVYSEKNQKVSSIDYKFKKNITTAII